MRFLITGAAGFIGQSLSKSLLLQGHSVFALDSMNPYYSLELKRLRVKELYDLSNEDRFTFTQADVSDEKISSVVKDFSPEIVVHLAAQPGVRLGISGAKQYSRDNIEAFLKILGATVDSDAKSFLFASSSSVYGVTSSTPFSEEEIELQPASIYGVTKLANEMFASTIKDSGVRCRGMRFFSVYGPRGRPDMAYFRAIAASLFGSQFYLNGTGEVARDFTYIDDVCQSIMLLSEELNVRPFGFNDVVNIGGGSPVTINHLINVVSEKTGKHIDVVNRSSIQEDLPLTQANYRYLQLLTNKKQFLDFEKGIEETISWFLNYPASEVLSWLK